MSAHDEVSFCSGRRAVQLILYTFRGRSGHSCEDVTHEERVLDYGIQHF